MSQQSNCRKGENIYVADVDTRDAAAPIVSHTSDHLVDNLTGIGLGTCKELEIMHPAFGIFTSHTFQSNVRAVVDHLFQLTSDTGALWQLAEVYGLYLGQLLLDEFETPVLIDHDDA